MEKARTRTECVTHARLLRPTTISSRQGTGLLSTATRASIGRSPSQIPTAASRSGPTMTGERAAMIHAPSSPVCDARLTLTSGERRSLPGCASAYDVSQPGGTLPLITSNKGAKPESEPGGYAPWWGTMGSATLAWAGRVLRAPATGRRPPSAAAHSQRRRGGGSSTLGAARPVAAACGAHCAVPAHQPARLLEGGALGLQHKSLLRLHERQRLADVRCSSVLGLDRVKQLPGAAVGRLPVTAVAHKRGTRTARITAIVEQ